MPAVRVHRVNCTVGAKARGRDTVRILYERRNVEVVAVRTVSVPWVECTVPAFALGWETVRGIRVWSRRLWLLEHHYRPRICCHRSVVGGGHGCSCRCGCRVVSCGSAFVKNRNSSTIDGIIDASTAFNVSIVVLMLWVAGVACQ